MLLQASPLDNTSGPAPCAVIRGRALWNRCGFSHTALLDDTVALAPLAPSALSLADTTAFNGGFAGLSVDRHCRVFHPAGGAALEYSLWGTHSSLRLHQDAAKPFRISGPQSETGNFGSTAPLPRSIVATACDAADYLYLADPAYPAIWLIDTWQGETARLLPTSSPPRDLAYAGGTVYCLLDNSWFAISPCDPPQPLPWPSGLGGADRLAVNSRGEALVLLQAGQATAELVSLANTQVRLPVPFATDVLIAEEDPERGLQLVVARRPGEDFLQLRMQGRHFSPLQSLQAPHYDGRGIALAPDGRIAYWTGRGLRHAAPARTQYAEQGLVYGFALDSSLDQTHWGTLRLTACIPEGTQVRLYALTRDDLDFNDPLPRSAPAGEALSPVPLEERYPLASSAAWQLRAEAAGQSLFKDPSRSPLSSPSDGFAQYEAPIIAAPGRYLWLVLELTGSRSKTPRLRGLQVDYPAQDLLKLLPRTLWREPAAQAFLSRYLAPAAALLSEWGALADGRQRLLNPQTSPSEALAWVGGLLGLSMEPCWSERAQRLMLQEVSQLFRTRGTLGSLKRMLEILTNAQVIIIEKFRLRGGGVLGNPSATQSHSVLGMGFRVGGNLGKDADTELVLTAEEAFDDFAHRFNVTLVANLSAEQLGCVRRLIETHKPAHTEFDLCTLASGLRVGVGLHLGVASAIGKSSGFDLLTLGDAVLGKGYLLGRPALDASVDEEVAP